MIPQHYIEKAVAAAEANWAPPADWAHAKTRKQVTAALEAVAADIWDEGWKAGLDYEADWTYYRAGERPRPKLPAHPYRSSETA